MEVIRHQAETVDDAVITLAHQGQNIERGDVIAIVAVDDATPIAARSRAPWILTGLPIFTNLRSGKLAYVCLQGLTVSSSEF
jgi:hypothetical protein